MKTTLKLKIIVLFLTVFACNNDDTPDSQETKSDAKQLLSFSFLSNDNANLSSNIVATIDESGKTISASVPNGTDLSGLNPKITVSEKATFDPGGTQDFTEPVTYTVIAEDSSQVIYTVTITIIEANDAVLENISPSEGPKGTIVTISGSDFGFDLSEVSVFFNEVEAEVQSITNTEIITLVPPRAYTGEVKVMINNSEIIGPIFSYILSDVQVTTYAGNEEFGFVDGPATNARFKQPTGLDITSDGTLYVADALNNKIRKISPEGLVSTLAGSTNGIADGLGSEAQFNVPTRLVVDGEGVVYVSDTENQRIRKITPEGMVTTYSGSTQGFNDGTAAEARYILPTGVDLDSQGALFIASSHKIRKITPEEIVSTIVGVGSGYIDATGTEARLNNPNGIVMDAEDNIFVADRNNNAIRKITSEAVVSTFAGGSEGTVDGMSTMAQFNKPLGIAIDSDGTLYVADTDNHRIRKITTDGVVTTLAGGAPGYQDGSGESAQFYAPSGLAVGANGTIYVADVVNNCIRKITQE